MNKRQFDVELSSSSVKSIIRQLEAYAHSLDEKVEEVCKRLAEEGVNTAVSAVRVDTGALRDGIYMQRSGDCEYLVISYSPYAWFVEFGTGVVGEGTYPGDLPAGWRYDERRSPWAHDPDDPTVWYYVSGGRRFSTQGQPANAYMLAASEEMRQKVLNVAREVFAS